MTLFDLEIAVDHLIPSPTYYLTPMNIAWAVSILRRAAEECEGREIRRSKLYEALDFLEKNIDAPVLVKKYRRALQGIAQTNGRRNSSGRFSQPRPSTFSAQPQRCW